MRVWPIVFVAVIVVLAIVIVDRLLVQSEGRELPYSAFYEAVQLNQVAQVTISGHDVTGMLKRGTPSKQFATTAPDDPTLLPLLRRHRVVVTYATPHTTPVASILFNMVPFALTAVLLVFLLRRAQLQRTQVPSSVPGGTAGIPSGVSGLVNADGTIVAGQRFSVSRTGVGTYTVTCDASAFFAGFPAISVTPWGGTAALLSIDSAPTGAGNSAFTVRSIGTNGEPQDHGFALAVIPTS